jgi:hypothetical protein
MIKRKFKGIGELPYGGPQDTFDIDPIFETKFLGVETEDEDGSKYVLMRGCVGLTTGDIVLYDGKFNTILGQIGLTTYTQWQGFAIYCGDVGKEANSSSKAGYFLVKGNTLLKVPPATPVYGPLFLGATPGLVDTVGAVNDYMTGLSVQSPESNGFSDVNVYNNAIGTPSGTVPSIAFTGTSLFPGVTLGSSSTVLKTVPYSAVPQGQVFEMGAIDPIFVAPHTWDILGNAGTSDLVNFIGTTDNQDVVIKRNNVERIRLDNTQNTITGDTVIFGDLNVKGVTTTIESTTVTVADKNIELGTTTTPTDITADGGGITLKGTTDKTIKWLDVDKSWHLNQSTVIEGNTTLGGSSLDRVVFNGQISGATPITFQGATDNLFTTTFAITDPTANNIIGFPDLSGNVLLDTSGWAYNGNTVIVEKTIGTKDAFDFPIIVNNLERLRISQTGRLQTSNTSGSNTNNFIGTNSGNETLTGAGNIGFGGLTLGALTTGDANTGIGFKSARLITTGNNNTAMGRNSLATNSIGNNNTAIGKESQTLATGSSNTSVGWAALETLGVGDGNTAVGNLAGANLITGTGNTFVGDSAGSGITTGSGNTIVGKAIGLTAGLTNTIILADGIGTQRLNITNTGLVGMGTIAPAAKLHLISSEANTFPVEINTNSVGTVQQFITNATPEGVILGSVGDLATDTVNGFKYIKTLGINTNIGWERILTESYLPRIDSEDYFENITDTSVVLSGIPIPDSTQVYENGQRLREGTTEDYTVSGNIINFNYQLINDDVLVEYKTI